MTDQKWIYEAGQKVRVKKDIGHPVGGARLVVERPMVTVPHTECDVICDGEIAYVCALREPFVREEGCTCPPIKELGLYKYLYEFELEPDVDNR